MFWKRSAPILTVALSRLHVEADADLQIPLETHVDYELALRIIRFARRKSLPVKTWRVYLTHERDVDLKLQWLLDISAHGSDVELFCPNPSRIQRILARHRSTIRVYDSLKEPRP